MRISGTNIGLGLAVLAGCIAIAQAVWPGVAPQGESLNFWLPLSIVAGAAFLAGAMLADRHTPLAKGLLFVGGAALIASGLYFGLTAGGGTRSMWAVAADVAPGLLAIAAGVLIGPVRRHAIP